jgi:hypothetical protein
VREGNELVTQAGKFASCMSSCASSKVNDSTLGLGSAPALGPGSCANTDSYTQPCGLDVEEDVQLHLAMQWLVKH